MRKGTDPRRRIAPRNALNEDERRKLAAALLYEGNANHKKHPGDYGFVPPVNPRPSKSICDGVRIVLKAEARTLFKAGILKGMISLPIDDGQPKYVWAVDGDREAYEAKIGKSTNAYHGYRLEEEDNMRSVVLKEWKSRS